MSLFIHTPCVLFTLLSLASRDRLELDVVWDFDRPIMLGYAWSCNYSLAHTSPKYDLWITIVRAPTGAGEFETRASHESTRNDKSNVNAIAQKNFEEGRARSRRREEGWALDSTSRC